jgi:hypothetical protein
MSDLLLQLMQLMDGQEGRFHDTVIGKGYERSGSLGWEPVAFGVDGLLHAATLEPKSLGV